MLTIKILFIFAIILLSSFNYAKNVQNFERVSINNELMYPYNLSDFTEITSAKPIHVQPLPFRLSFFGFSFNYLWITRDGYITFNKGMFSYKFPVKFPILPRDILMEEDPSIIAPWFALQDIATKVPNAGVYLKILNLENEKDINLTSRIYSDFKNGLIGAGDFKPKFALIITWRNMTMINRRPEMPLVTNTYQCVLATDEMRTYVMFNYDQIQWITHQDPYEGLKGAPAYVGFNAGNTTRTYEYKPYSQNPRISYLISRGYGNGLKGRHYFQIDEEAKPGSCIEKDLDPFMPDRLPLIFFPKEGSMLGGTIVNVTGPCLTPDSEIICKFGNWRSKGVFQDFNHATCITPQIFYHGYIDLSLTVNDRTIFIGNFLLQPPDLTNDNDIKIANNDEQLEAPKSLHIKWNPNKLNYWDANAEISMSLWGYQATTLPSRQLTYIDSLVLRPLYLNEKEIILDLADFKDRLNPSVTNLTFGFISISLVDTRMFGTNLTTPPSIWSGAMPLAWYFKPQWEKEYAGKENWKEHFCNSWAKTDINITSQPAKCPCTLPQASLDRGRFMPDIQCNVIDRKCDTFYRGAFECFNLGRPTADSSEQTCCYDDYNELIRTDDTMYAGRTSRAHSYGKYPFNANTDIPVLSKWTYDTMPYLFCCKWQQDGDSKTCQLYNSRRPSHDCTAYESPAIGSVYGDPHMITFDGLNYTFNGRGEFTLLHLDNFANNLEVQGRFEQLPRLKITDPLINATVMTAIVAKDNLSSVVEFRMRPDAARWRYRMYLLVDKEYIIWPEDKNFLNLRGVTLYQPAGMQNMSHIIAMFDSGAGIEVMQNDNQLTVHAYAPETFLNRAIGLFGKYSKKIQDDFTTRNHTEISILSTQSDIHSEFGMSWRVKERITIIDNETSSLFYHDAISYAYYDDPDFEPDYQIPAHLPDWAKHLQAEMETVCSGSIPCQYDYVQTFDKNFAENTKSIEDYAKWLSLEANKKWIRCPSLARPIHGHKSENRYWPGTIVRFSCDPGYKLYGTEVVRCNEVGIWEIEAGFSLNITVPVCK